MSEPSSTQLGDNSPAGSASQKNTHGAQSTWNEAKAQVLARWGAMQPRERVAAAWLGGAFALLLVWLVAIGPAIVTLQKAPKALETLELELQDMQRMASEARALRTVAAIGQAQAAQTLQAATERLGAQAQLTITGDRATLVLNGVSSDALSAWLGEARSAAHAVPVEAELNRSGAGYNGTLTLNLGGGSQ